MWIYEDALQGVGQVNVMVEWISIEELLPIPMDYWFCEGVLFIKKCLSKERILKIIKQHISLGAVSGTTKTLRMAKNEAHAKEIIKETVDKHLLKANDLSMVRFVNPVFPLDYFYYEGNLFIKRDLPVERVKEIIMKHLYCGSEVA